MISIHGIHTHKWRDYLIYFFVNQLSEDETDGANKNETQHNFHHIMKPAHHL